MKNQNVLDIIKEKIKSIDHGVNVNPTEEYLHGQLPVDVKELKAALEVYFKENLKIDF